MTFSVASLIASLREHRLLEGVAEAEIAALQGRFQDVRLLAKELIERGWLTPFQVNQVFQGRAADLLLGSYILLERIGEGGMGQVFKARNWKLGKIVALKVIRKERLSNPNIIRRFHREMEAAGKLDHVNIVRAFVADQVGETHFFAMEYIEGTDLAKLVRKQGRMPVDTACDTIRQAALGLQHAMERGLTHRDIKPANLLLSDGVVKILDMGLALLQQLDDSESGSTLTHEGAVMGTPDYMAPEQSLDSHKVDIRADVYSLGCTLYFLLTGTVPFPGGTMTEKLLRHQSDAPPPVEILRTEVSDDLATLIRKLMAKQPDERYQTPAELANALDELMARGGCVARGEKKTPAANPFAQFGTEAAAGPATPERAWGPWWIGGGAALVVMVLTFVIVQLFRPRNGGTKGDVDSSGITVRVEANRPWQDSGIDVQAGTPLTISVRGQWEKKGWGQVPAWGVDNMARERTILQDVAPMCLLGRVGNQEPLPVGKLRTWTPSEGGRLFLQANYLDLEETTGSVKVEIKGGTAATKEMAAPPPARVEAAEAELARLQARAGLASEDPKKFRSDLLEFGQKYWGTFQAARAAPLLIPLPSPLDALDAANIPVEELALAGKGDPLSAPPGLMAILGDSRKQRSPLRTVAVNFDGSRIASAGDDFKASIWDAATGKRIFHLTGHAGRIDSLAFSLNGKWLASASWDKTVKVWDVLTGKEIASFEHDQKEQAVAFHPSGKSLVSAAKNNAIRIWKRSAESAGFVLDRQPGNYASLALSPDGKNLAMGGPENLKIKDVEAGKKILTLDADRSNGVAFSRDGKRLASAGKDIEIWDAATGKELHRLKGHKGEVLAVAFRADGRLLASAGEDGKVSLWDIVAGRALREWLHPWGPVRSLAFAGDGRHLITGNENGTVYVIRLGPPAFAAKKWVPVAKSYLDSLRQEQISAYEWKEAGEPRDLVAVLGDSRFRHWQRVNGVAFHPKDKKLATVSADMTVGIWDPASGKRLNTLRGHTGNINQVAYSPDGKYLATAGVDSLRIWDAEAEREIRSLKGHVNDIYGVVFSSDGKRLVSTSRDQTIKVWNLETGKEIITLKGHRNLVNGCALHPTRNRLASFSDDHTVKVWDLDKGTVLLDYSAHASSIAYSPDGTRLAVGQHNWWVTVWDEAGSQEIKKWNTQGGRVHGLAFSKDSQHVFTGNSNGSVKMWETGTGQEIRSFPGPFQEISGLTLDSTAELLAACGEGGVRIWNIKTAKETVPVPGHSGAVVGLAVTADGKWIVSAALDQSTKEWDAASGREKGSFTAGYYPSSYLAIISPDGRRLATPGPGHVIHIRDRHGHEILSLVGHAANIRGLAFSPDGIRLVSGGETKTVKVWDAATGQQLLSMKQSSHATSIAFNPNGREFAVGDVSGKVRIYGATAGQLLFSLEAGEHVRSLAYSSQGNLLATGGYTGKVALWNLATQKAVFSINCKGGRVDGVAFSPSGDRFASVDEKHLILWNGRSGKKVQEWPSPGRRRSVAFAPDGRHLLTGNDNGTIYVFRLPRE